MCYKYNLSQNCPNFNLQKADYDLYYRFIKGLTPQKDDFLPHYFMKKYQYKKWGDNECSAQGISLFGDIADIKMMINSLPNINKKFKSVYSGKIKKTDGEIFKNASKKKPTHCDFYAFKSCNEIDIFKEKEIEI